MDCRESKGQIVFPIFYKVEPSEEIYQKAFSKHEQTMRLKSFFWRVLNWVTFCLPFEICEEETINREIKLESWKSAFRKTLELAGWPIGDKCNEAEIIKIIASEVSKNLKDLKSSHSKGEELIPTSTVGQTAEDNFKRIWECLMSDKTLRVGVYGMGGVGKTTITTRINNDLCKRSDHPFTHIYWVTVSKDSNPYNLQSGIARVMKLDFCGEDDEKKRAAMLWKRLINEKFVLILDDVWEVFNMEDVGIPILEGGGKLLLTTRNLRVCERMDYQPIKVKTLSETEAHNLFIRESRYQENNSLEWRGILESVVKECGGLPLAIVVLTRSLSGTTKINEWKKVL